MLVNPNGNGAAYAKFTFQVQDNGDTAGGGSNLDPTPNTITIGVTPVHFTTPVKEWFGASGDEIILSNDEVLAGTPTVDGIVYVDGERKAA